MVRAQKIEVGETRLTLEQVKLLDYLQDITQELSEIAKAGGFAKVSSLLEEATIEVKAIC